MDTVDRQIKVNSLIKIAQVARELECSGDSGDLLFFKFRQLAYDSLKTAKVLTNLTEGST